MPRFRTLDDLDVAGKRVLVRADLNVPVRDGRVTDATRIERLAPTIGAIIERGGKPVVMSHFGRPKGPDPSQSLRPIVEPLSCACGGRTVRFASDCVGQEAERVVGALQQGEIALLENLRFHPGEEDRLEQGGNILRIGGVAFVDRRAGLRRERAELVGLSGSDRDGEPVLRKQPGQRGAEARARADDQRRAVFWLVHRAASLLGKDGRYRLNLVDGKDFSPWTR